MVPIVLCWLLITSNLGTWVEKKQTNDFILVQNTRHTENPQIEELKYSIGNSNSVTLSRTQLPRSMVLISTKILNRIVRARNGNRSSSNTLKVIHWNAGSRLWENKTTEIESLVLQLQPDLCYISEANLWEKVDEMESKHT